jgi:2-keto-4-pentenoate hydratase/2-oxohepta-3-ene-1,7-dioic acid hydratase in catechol pathway
MRIANSAGRLVLLDPDDRAVDVAEASGGRFSADPQAVYDRWAEFHEWAATASFDAARPLDVGRLGPVTPAPRQVFAVGLNYRAHAEESGFALPTEPVVFTKYVSSLTGPGGDITLSPGNVDWEVELVAAIGEGGRDIPAEHGWAHVAGLTVGQDISDRTTQFAAPPAQFGLGKSYPGFSPVGPWLVTPDAVDDPDDLEIGCTVNGEGVQKSRTSDLIFPVAELVARLSAVVTLLPGDLIFTGTPSGVGQGRTPPRFLQDGDVLETWCSGIGRMRHRFVRG